MERNVTLRNTFKWCSPRTDILENLYNKSYMETIRFKAFD